MSCPIAPSSSAQSNDQNLQCTTIEETMVAPALTSIAAIPRDHQTILETFPPNVIGIISDFLSTINILVCVRVSRGFKEIWSPSLFRELDLTEESLLEGFEFTELQDRLKMYCGITRSFRSTHAIKHCQLLKGVNCWNLKRLDLRFNREPKFTYDSKIELDLIKGIIHANTRLYHIVLHGRMDWSTSNLFSTCSFLSCLELDFKGSKLSPQPKSSYGSLKSEGNLPGLKSLTIVGFKGSSSSLLSLFFESPNLKVVTVRRQDAWVPFGVPVKELEGILSNLESLVLEATEICGLGLSEMLAIGPGVKAVAISAIKIHTLKPLVKRAEGIESLVFDGVLGKHGSDLQSILEKAVSLRELCTLPSAPLQDAHVRLTSDDLYDDQETMQVLTMSECSAMMYWACEETITRLEIVVECAFTASNEGQMSLESRSEHAVVYEQLGRLVHLQHLQLGRRGVHGGFLADCLLFSLESGLDFLSRMKEMRILDVRWIAHEIGKRELEWMHHHWPKMVEVTGLQRLPPGASEQARNRVSEAYFGWLQHHKSGIGRDFYERLSTTPTGTVGMATLSFDDMTDSDAAITMRRQLH
ncbi:hypothetical protein EMPS_06887 [Entomortierella parvispora]|uniref:F-box domain-containing protein n=1 Tax=Entomortierella parvispora TaxID=205924 RepID=A0A9P3LXU8_9FUNG|nr:hypothetical protein EMPS_06887 [Entomortierella parvispora]